MMKKNSERNAAIRFMKKLFILFIPFIALLAVYVLDDPFMVLKNYERYDQTPVVLNEGHVGWQMYLNNRDTIPIDSYIMGNSCTMAYQCHEWEKYLHGGRAVRLFGNAESLAAVADDVRVSRAEIRRDYICGGWTTPDLNRGLIISKLPEGFNAAIYAPPLNRKRTRLLRVFVRVDGDMLKACYDGVEHTITTNPLHDSITFPGYGTFLRDDQIFG